MAPNNGAAGHARVPHRASRTTHAHVALATHATRVDRSARLGKGSLGVEIDRRRQTSAMLLFLLADLAGRLSVLSWCCILSCLSSTRSFWMQLPGLFVQLAACLGCSLETPRWRDMTREPGVDSYCDPLIIPAICPISPQAASCAL